MPGKIFVNCRRDDGRAFAARVRDRLAQAFGNANVFMDVDNLMAGQRFDRELEKALAETDVFLAVIGPRWLDLYQQRQATAERDYVHEEIAGALKRGVTVIPVLIEGAKLPRGDALPTDIRALVMHQKHDVGHERFGRDVDGLVEAIRFARKAARPAGGAARWGAVTLGVVLAVLVAGWAAASYFNVPLPWAAAKVEAPRRGQPHGSDPIAQKSAADAEAARKAAEEARLNAEKSAADARAEQERLRKVEAERQAAAKKDAEERAAAQKAEDERQARAAAKKAEEELAAREKAVVDAKREAEARRKVEGEKSAQEKSKAEAARKGSCRIHPEFGLVESFQQCTVECVQVYGFTVQANNCAAMCKSVCP